MVTWGSTEGKLWKSKSEVQKCLKSTPKMLGGVIFVGWGSRLVYCVTKIICWCLQIVGFIYKWRYAHRFVTCKFKPERLIKYSWHTLLCRNLQSWNKMSSFGQCWRLRPYLPAVIMINVLCHFSGELENELGHHLKYSSEEERHYATKYRYWVLGTRTCAPV